jgi:hypothetical protein
MWRGPHAEWSGPVVFLGAEMECSAIVSLDLRAQRSGVRLRDDGLVVEELGGPFGLPAGCGFAVSHRW